MLKNFQFFSSSVDSSCYHRFNTTNRGIFHTPNFPNNYDVKKRCGWEIIAPENTADITITFNTFKVEPSKRCRYYDHMMIYRKAFGQTNWETIGFQEGYCGEQIPFQISSSTKRIFVLFVSDDTQVFQGFNATYEIRITQGNVLWCQIIIVHAALYHHRGSDLGAYANVLSWITRCLY